MTELHRWLHDLDVHAVAVGIPVGVSPRWASGAPRTPTCRYATSKSPGVGKQLIERGADEHPLIVVILTAGDEPCDRLYTGIAMMHVM